MSEEIELMMRQVKLGGMAKEWRSVQFESTEQYVTDLLKLELKEREANRINRMVKTAGFRVLKTLDDFVWTPAIELPSGLTAEYMEEDDRTLQHLGALIDRRPDISRVMRNCHLAAFDTVEVKNIVYQREKVIRAVADLFKCIGNTRWGSSAFAAAILVMPMMPFSGVRISWLIWERNLVLAAFALFASASAFSSAPRLAFSASLLALSLLVFLLEQDKADKREHYNGNGCDQNARVIRKVVPQGIVAFCVKHIGVQKLVCI
jgi:hypothetical protein